MRKFERIIDRFVQWEPLGLDLRSLAVFRIALALILLIDLWTRAKNMEAHYTDAGVLPRKALEGISVFHHRIPMRGLLLSFHRLSGTLRTQKVLFGVHALFVLALFSGCYTRLATIGSWLMLFSLHRRNPVLLQADDIIRRLLLFWAMFLPLGTRFSVDEVRNRSPQPPPTRIHSWGTVGYVGQLALIYWFNSLTKSDPVWRKEGTAIYYALRLEEYATAFGRSLLRYPALLKKLTFFTLWFELLAPCLLFMPRFLNQSRLLLVTAFTLFHAGIGRSLALGLFGLTCTVAWLPLLPSNLWEGLDLLLWSFVAKRRPQQVALPTQPGSLFTPPLPTGRRTPISLLFSSDTLQELALFAFILMILSNLRYLFAGRLARFRLAWFDYLCAMFGLTQYWYLFAPRPGTYTGWPVIQGVLENGTEIDLLHGGAPLSWDKPKNPAASFPDSHWRAWQQRLWRAKFGHLRSYYLQYLQNQWNHSHPAGQRLVSVRFYYIVEEILPDLHAGKPIKVLLWDHARQTPQSPTMVGIDLSVALLARQLENGEIPASDSQVTTADPILYNGFVIRPPTRADLPGIVALLDVAARATYGQPQFTLETYTTEWEAPGFDPGRDSRIAVTDEGQIVARVDLISPSPHVRNFLYLSVHPAYCERGLGSYLTQWGEACMRARLPEAPAGARVSLFSSSISTHQAAFDLLREHGYQYVRSFYNMKIDLASPPPMPVWPPGIQVRLLQPGEEAALYAAEHEAFQDHWGHIASTAETNFARWWQTLQSKPDYDPSLIFLAMAGSQIAGFAICFPANNEFPGMAWIDHLGVRRPWRRQRLGLALVHHCFGEFHRRGIAQVALGVDAASLTGATRLYEKAGMQIFRQLDAYEKELRPGRDLTTQTLAAHTG